MAFIADSAAPLSAQKGLCATPSHAWVCRDLSSDRAYEAPSGKGRLGEFARHYMASGIVTVIGQALFWTARWVRRLGICETKKIVAILIFLERFGQLAELIAVDKSRAEGDFFRA